MQKSLLVVLFLLLVCGGALAWLLGGGPDAGPQVPVTGPGAQATVDPDLAQGDAPAPTPEVRPDNARVAADPTPKAADTSGPCLVGQIVDPSGAPVAGAEVSTSSVRIAALRNFDANEIDFGDVNAMRDRIRTMAADRTIAVTGDDGRFRLPSRSDSARIDLAVHARGFRVLRRGAERPTAEDVDLGTLKLDSGAVVSGRVIDAQNQPVGGAVVLAMPSRMDNFGIPAQFEAVGMEMMGGLGTGEDAETRADGTFELAHVAPGEFTLRAQHPDHPLARKDGLRRAPRPCAWSPARSRHRATTSRAAAPAKPASTSASWPVTSRACSATRSCTWRNVPTRSTPTDGSNCAGCRPNRSTASARCRPARASRRRPCAANASS
jgi:hypothetical protein